MKSYLLVAVTLTALIWANAAISETRIRCYEAFGGDIVCEDY